MNSDLEKPFAIQILLRSEITSARNLDEYMLNTRQPCKCLQYVLKEQTKRPPKRNSSAVKENR